MRNSGRKMQVWLRCAQLPPEQRALALYSALSGRAWSFSEELNLDRLATAEGVEYFQEWIRTRVLDLELTKVGRVMTEFFRKFKRRPEQAVRDYNMEYERMILRLQEVSCELPPLLKAWAYLDKMGISESNETALLSSAGNQFDYRLLQRAALLQDRTLRSAASREQTMDGSGKDVNVVRPPGWPRTSMRRTRNRTEPTEEMGRSPGRTSCARRLQASCAPPSKLTWRRRHGSKRQSLVVEWTRIRPRPGPSSDCRKPRTEANAVARARLEHLGWVKLYHVLIGGAEVVVVSRSGEDDMDLMTRTAPSLVTPLFSGQAASLCQRPLRLQPSWIRRVAGVSLATTGSWSTPGLRRPTGCQSTRWISRRHFGLEHPGPINRASPCGRSWAWKARTSW